MALKVELKPGERIILGTAVITNDSQRTRLFIEGDAPILRQKDIMTPEESVTPAKRIYMAVQIMYLESSVEKYRKQYFELTNDIIEAAPSMFGFVDEINNHILSDNLYKALKSAAKLVAYEGEILSNAEFGGPGLQQDGEDHAEPPAA